MSRAHHHNHQRRRRNTLPKIRGMAVVSLGQALSWMGECDCPSVTISGPLLQIVHDHRHACPALRRWR